MACQLRWLAGLLLLAGCSQSSTPSDGPAAGYVAQSELDDLQARFDALLNEYHTKLRLDENAQLKESIESAETREAELSARIAFLEAEIKELNETLRAAYKSRDDALSKVKELSPEPSEGGKLFTIVDINARITETNEIWSRFAWILEVKSNTSDALLLSGTIKFLDADGFVVDTERVYDLALRGREDGVFRGAKLIDAASVPKVNNFSVELRAN